MTVFSPSTQITVEVCKCNFDLTTVSKAPRILDTVFAGIFGVNTLAAGALASSDNTNSSTNLGISTTSLAAVGLTMALLHTASAVWG
jgi:hypothetical protein